MHQYTRVRGTALALTVGLAVAAVALLGRPAGGADEKSEPSEKGKDADRGKTSYDQVSPALTGQVSFAEMMEKDKKDKPAVMDRQTALLKERYDLTPKPDDKVKMTRGKPVCVGPTAKLPEGTTFEQLAGMRVDEIRDRGLFPKGYLPLPHPNHAAGGMVFPKQQV